MSDTETTTETDADATPQVEANATPETGAAGEPHVMLSAPPLDEFEGDVASIAGFLPDTPWTTPAVHACERRRARVWVDCVDMPQNVIVLVPGNPETDSAATAHLFGSEADPAPLVRFANDFEGALDVVCDDAVGHYLIEALPTLTQVEHAVRWFERLDTVERPEMPGLRRLRLRDEEAILALGAPDLLRSFETMKDLLMVGGASGIIAQDEVLAAAFTVDQSVNYARVVVFTAPDHRGKNLGTATARHIVAAHHEQGRLACIVVRADNEAGEGLARTTGFEAAARMTTFLKR